MDDKVNGVAPAVDDEDLNTTAPNPPNEWQMPKPVFRKTSGRLPQGFEKELENARAEHAASVAEEGTAEPTSPEFSRTDLTGKPSAVKLTLVLLALAAMIAFIAIFLTVIYFFFWRS